MLDDFIERFVKILSRTWGDQIGGHIGISLFVLPFWELVRFCSVSGS